MNCFFHSNWKRQAMVCILLHSLPFIFWSDAAESQSVFFTKGDIKSAKVYKSKTENYTEKLPYPELFRMIARLENEQSITINPVNFPLIAIYFDTHKAPGLFIKTNLLKTLIKFLEIRGFAKEEILLVTYQLEYTTIQNIQNDLPGYQVVTSRSEKYFHPDWFHDSPIPPAMGDRAELIIKYPKNLPKRRSLERKSSLPSCLFLSNAYWINLATVTEDYYLGIDGSTTSVTLNASSNTERFRKDSILGPATATEILAIPEFLEKQLFSVLDLSEIQIAGGPAFNAEFIRQTPYLLLSKNSVFLDFHAMKIICEERKITGLEERSVKDCKMFLFAEELGFGKPINSEVVYLSPR